MGTLSKVLRVVAATVMAVVVAGFMLAFINSDSRDFFLAVSASPLALIFFGVSSLLDPNRHHDDPQQSAFSR
jgi:hypothetical protein